MATGIFSTVRVAGEGVALAIVGAVLSMLVAARLAAAGMGGNSAAVAQRLAGGDLAGALALVPGGDAATLVARYGEALGWLLVLLAGITTLTAVVVFLFLGKDGETALPAANAEPHDRPPQQGVLPPCSS